MEELARQSDLVVHGRVVSSTPVLRGPGGQPGIHTRSTIAIEEVLRGAPSSNAVEVWTHGGALEGMRRVVVGQASFEVGEDVVVFLFEAGRGYWPTGMSRGKWLVDDRSSSPTVRPDATHPEATSDRDAGPRLNGSLTLSRLRARVASVSEAR